MNELRIGRQVTTEPTESSWHTTAGCDPCDLRPTPPHRSTGNRSSIYISPITRPGIPPLSKGDDFGRSIASGPSSLVRFICSNPGTPGLRARSISVSTWHSSKLAQSTKKPPGNDAACHSCLERTLMNKSLRSSKQSVYEGQETKQNPSRIVQEVQVSCLCCSSCSLFTRHVTVPTHHTKKWKRNTLSCNYK